MVISSITYSYAGIFSQYKLLNNYTDIFNELSFLLLLCANVMNTSYAQTIKFKFFVD